MISTFNHVISHKVAEVFDLYTELHGTRVSFFGPDQTLIYPEATSRPNCAYCRMLREDLALDALCRQLDQQMMDAALKQKKMISYTCHGGMREAAAPLFSGGQLAGFVMIGQFRSRKAPAISPYAAQWKTEKKNEALQEAFEKTTLLPEKKIETLLAMLSQLLELIISSQLIHHKEYDLIEPVIERIHTRPEEPLSLTEAARLSNRSPSTVSRLFKKITGRSFKQYQTDSRLQFAAELLTASSNLPVSEVARRAGFEDPFYFSRIFHKYTGFSPSDYRNKETGK
ncbi:MAG: PocR ligand-binding domain-containing protein [Kiritimatiellales bacterium]|nr:PocR ligand-binding domain-containing protein [Kiritimatiellales bacterium]